MSHEGIRFVSREEAEQAAREERELPVEAITPVKVKVDKTGGTGMSIEWKDGHRSQWNFDWLRNACPCATCIEERKHENRQPGVAPPRPQTLLPMFVAPPRPTQVTPVGRYAISFHWTDGHTSGIYSWDYLRRHSLPPAPEFEGR